jgi:hypothetical protein
LKALLWRIAQLCASHCWEEHIGFVPFPAPS